LHAAARVDYAVNQIHLVPPERQSLTVGPTTGLNQQHNRNPEVRWRRFENSMFFVNSEHSLGWPFLALIEMLHIGSWISCDVLSPERRSTHPPLKRPNSRTCSHVPSGVSCLMKGSLSRTSSRLAVTRATSLSECTRTERRARSSSGWPRKGPRFLASWTA